MRRSAVVVAAVLAAQHPQQVAAQVLATQTTTVSTGKAGYTTFQVSVSLDNRVQDVYALYGEPADGPSSNRELIVPPAFQVAAPFGSNVGPTNPAFFPMMPDCEFDSFLTIGMDGPATVPGALSSIGIDLGAWSDRTGISSADGALFFMDPDHGATSDRVVLAQVTVPTGTHFSGQLNVQGRSNVGDDWEATGLRFSDTDGGGAPPPPPPRPLPCPAGTFGAAPGTCMDCMAGMFSSRAGSAMCTACAAGTYADMVGATACRPCAAGTHLDMTGGTACTPIQVAPPRGGKGGGGGNAGAPSGDCSTADATLMGSATTMAEMNPLVPQLTAACNPCLQAHFSDVDVTAPFPDLVAALLAFCGPADPAGAAGNAPFSAEFYFGSEMPTTAGADAILDDGTGFAADREGGLSYGWDCDGDTHVDYSGGRRGTNRDSGLGINHFDRSGTCGTTEVPGHVNWSVQVPNGACTATVDFGESVVGVSKGLHCMVEGARVCDRDSLGYNPTDPGDCVVREDTVVVDDGMFTVTGYSHDTGRCHSISQVILSCAGASPPPPPPGGGH